MAAFMQFHDAAAGGPLNWIASEKTPFCQFRRDRVDRRIVIPEARHTAFIGEASHDMAQTATWAGMETNCSGHHHQQGIRQRNNAVTLRLGSIGRPRPQSGFVVTGTLGPRSRSPRESDDSTMLGVPPMLEPLFIMQPPAVRGRLWSPSRSPRVTPLDHSHCALRARVPITTAAAASPYRVEIACE
ncbi:uncharacterized protein BDZ99DRAFT_513116 [Mytilinidion resinicola]|uniref:Uncharacterized protein n=1 Tax=Mytilinidion resinicola TaxID=574789 RepID=A0A6A6Z7Z9_9PEZI|nr:uncharacterized protein BDZ99DRAFT_513116 [Mytilinidion resinicola]KAF2816843.1 hypothetical protein BDZ99DRAFT_513116 [Mytilinidion resinicola]